MLSVPASAKGDTLLTLYLGDTIFELMEFPSNEQSDHIFENVYLANAEKVRTIDFSQSTHELDRLINEIYQELIFAKKLIPLFMSE